MIVSRVDHVPVDASVAVADAVDLRISPKCPLVVRALSNHCNGMSSKSAVAAAKSQVAERRLRPIYGKKL